MVALADQGTVSGLTKTQRATSLSWRSGLYIRLSLAGLSACLVVFTFCDAG